MFHKRLFYASASLLMLALAYHIGASTAGAQAPSNPVVGIAVASNSGFYAAITANGDVLVSSDNTMSWRRTSNCFGVAGPTAAQSQSFGALKAKYR